MPPTRYLEIAEALAEELSGLPTGSQVPSESDVAGRFRVGRSAARAAIGELEQRGLVRRIQGAGTFVQRPLVLTIRAGEPTAWEQMVRMGIGRTTVPSIRAVPLPQAASTAMGLPAGHPGVRLSVLMSAYDEPIGRSALWAAGTDRSAVSIGLKEHESLLRLIDASQVRLSYRSAPVTLASAGPELAEELGIGLQRPYWKVDAVLEDPEKAITVWVGTEFRADRITLDLRIGDAAGLPVH
ncbi:MAG: GntR family transcriptional regulator [Actinomycetota bacterium]|nr:GntR family transcriptional regulator [Actinomycetota bacterium]